MTTLSPLLDLDDAAALVGADIDGSLRSAALAGAQVRATAGSFDDTVGDRLRDLRPRSVVFVAGDGRASRAGSFLVSALASRVAVPLVRSFETPPWVGPLDVVLVCGDDAGDPRLAESTSAAVRRGAETILITPDEGPLRAAGAGRVHLLPPRIAVRDHNALMRYVTAGICVLGSIGDGVYRSALPDPARLADALDAESASDHPSHEVFHNPAKSIATRMSGRRVVFTGTGPAAVDIARHASEVMLRAAGAVTTAGEMADVIAASVQVAGSSSTPSTDYDPFFHDEQVDGPRPEAPTRVLVLASFERALDAERRTTSLQDVDVLTAGAQDAGAGSDIESMALLATRLEIAAAYLHLMGGR